MERDFDTFDPNEALVDEARNRYYPAGWQKGDPVYVLNEPVIETALFCKHGEPEVGAPDWCVNDGGLFDSAGNLVVDPVFEGLEARKGLDCE